MVKAEDATAASQQIAATLEKELDTARQWVGEQEQQLAVLRRDLESKVSASSSLEKALAEALTKRGEAEHAAVAEQEKTKRLESEVSTAHQRLGDTEHQVVVLRQDLECQTGATRSAERALTEANTRLAIAEEAAAAEQEKTKRLESEVSTAHQRLGHAEHQVAVLRGDLESQTEATKSVETALAEATANLAMAEQAVAAEQDKAARLEDELGADLRIQSCGQFIAGGVQDGQEIPDTGTNMIPHSKDDIDVIRASELFDADWYLRSYPDVKVLGLDPAEHYLWFGARLNRNPSPAFDGAGYLRINSDVAAAGVNPLLHYEIWGKEEARLDGIKARPDVHELHSSTFHGKRPYSFVSAEALDAAGERYLRSRLLNGGTQPRSVVFTAITGGYDSVQYHEHLMDACDYCVFTDGEPKSGYVYKYNKISYFDEDPVRVARFVKTHAHMLLPSYTIAVWIDGNILVRDDLSEIIARFERSGRPLAAVPHPFRSSVYEEANECIKRAKDDTSAIEPQMARYRSEGFDCDDLIESNFMMFRLDHPQLAPFLNAWWAEIERGSRRDQLSFNYAMRKAGARWFPLTDAPNSVRNHPSLALFHHGSIHSPYVPQTALASEPPLTYADVIDARLDLQAGKTVDVVICVHNALDVVKLCLASVLSNRNEEHHRVIVVDDGSDSETAAWLGAFASQHTNIHLIRHEQAVGYTRAANAGLRASQAGLAVLLNSDTVVAGRWIEKLLDAAFSNPGVGIVGPLSSAASHQSIPDHNSTANQTAINDLPDGYSTADMNGWCEKNSPAGFVPRVPLVHGFCFAVTRELIKSIGYFDEVNFPFGFGEENDYCFRAVDAGYSLAVATSTYVYHKKSQSYDNDRRVALAKAGNQKIRELHGKERVLRAVRSMQKNPHLERMRTLAKGLFAHFSLQEVE